MSLWEALAYGVSAAMHVHIAARGEQPRSLLNRDLAAKGLTERHRATVLDSDAQRNVAILRDLAPGSGVSGASTPRRRRLSKISAAPLERPLGGEAAGVSMARLALTTVGP